MNQTCRNQDNSSGSGDRPESKLTTEDAKWLDQIHPECQAYIMALGNGDLSWSDAQDIFGDQLLKLSRLGMGSLYKGGECPERQPSDSSAGDSELLYFLKASLRQRISDFFRSNRRQRRDSRRVVDLDDYGWSIIRDDWQEDRVGEFPAREALTHLQDVVLPLLNKRERIMFIAALCDPDGKFNCTNLYDSMTPSERKEFLPRNGRSVVDQESYVKQTLSGLSKQLRIKIRKIITDHDGDFDNYAA